VFSTQKALKLLPWFIFPQPVKRCPDTKRGGTTSGLFSIRLRSAFSSSLLCSAFGGIRLLAPAFVGGIQADARDSRRFLDQIVGGASFVSRHH
jgi:hypothetical protein